MVNYLMLTEDIVYLSLEKLFSILGHTGIQILNSHMGALEPEKTYCVFNLYSHEQIGGADSSDFVSSSGDIIETKSHHKSRVQIKIVGNEASNIASSLHWSLQNDLRAYDSFAYNQVKVFGVDRNIRRSPQQREAEWVEGWSFDFTITSSLHVRYSYDWVEYITLNGESVKLPYKNN